MPHIYNLYSRSTAYMIKEGKVIKIEEKDDHP
jgi:hypothetical protein